MTTYQRPRIGTFQATVVTLLAGCAILACGHALGDDAVATEQATQDLARKVEFFESKVRPILVARCYTCHSAETKLAGGLRVDDRHGLLEGGSSGAAIVPGDVESSLILQAVRYEGGMAMPPEAQIPGEEIAVLERWVAEGAAWPVVDVPVEYTKPNDRYARLRQTHWAFQPVAPTGPPAVANPSWPRTPVDRFVLARLETAGLTPVGDADRATLIRRLSFDLTGLPPTADEIHAFVTDSSDHALETVVDRLLDSPAFGERWGRHWLDVARFGESTGSSRNIPYPQAWRYRDYVIDAFNADLPFDVFLKEQIAGDHIATEPAVGANPAERDRQTIATGFLAIGVKDVNQRFKVRFIMDNVDEQIDTTSRAFLGLTVSCARCHDHKFDPIPTADYYALAGIFRSTDLLAGVRNKMGGGGLDYYDTEMLAHLQSIHNPGADPSEIAKAQKAYDNALAAFERLKGNPEGDQPAPNGRPKRQVARNQMNRRLEELTALKDQGGPGIALGVRDAKTVADTEIRIRGEAEKLGPVVPRGFLTAFEVADAAPVDPATSGRRQLADWLASRNNPLTARVYVNRVWSKLFGSGLVRTVDNFGLTGDTPSHPELLDHLAHRFIAEGWSTKRLVRTLVLTRAYGLSADRSDAEYAADPDNRLVWRHAPRRLDAEELRDAALAVAGALDRSRPDGSAAAELAVREINNIGAEAKRLQAVAEASVHRSLYLPLLRDLVPQSLAVFDFAEQGLVTGQREETTVPTQALYLLNDAFVRRQAERIADQLLALPGTEDLVSTDGQAVGNDRVRIEAVYRLVFGRAATEREQARVSTFLTDFRRLDGTTFVSTVAASAGESDREAWIALGQALLGSAEFRYLP